MIPSMRACARVHRFAVGAATFASACLVENPDFVDTSVAGDQGDEHSCPADDDEPDDDESAATVLGSLNDDAPALALERVLEDPTAQDWFSFTGQATSGLTPQPHAQVTTTANAEIELCVFVECSAGPAATDASCADAGAEHTHTMGEYRPGCCRVGAVTVDPTCSDGVLDDMTIVVRAAASDAAVECVDYVLSVEF